MPTGTGQQAIGMICQFELQSRPALPGMNPKLYLSLVKKIHKVILDESFHNSCFVLCHFQGAQVVHTLA